MIKNNVFGILNKFITLGVRDNNPITPMKLQKLVFFTHAKLLQTTSEGLSKDLKFEAWEYGPVDSFIYQQFKEFSSTPVKKIFKFRSSDGILEDIIAEDGAEAVANEIWNNLGKYSATQLSLLSHRSGSPWAQKYKKGVKNIEIPNSLIKQYYSDNEKFNF